MRFEAIKPSDTPSVAQQSQKVFWLLHGDQSVASSRLQGYLVHQQLLRMQVPSALLLAPPFPVVDLPWKERNHWQLAKLLGSSVVILQKLRGPRTEHFVRFLRGTGACTVYVQSDYDPDNMVPFLCDAVVCSSEYLANFYRHNGAIHVGYIPDPAEFWCEPDEAVVPRPVERDLTLCWIGHPGNWETLASIRQILAEPEFSDMRLVTVSSHPDADVPWGLAAVQEAVTSCDLAVVPTGKGAEAFSKSSNRVILFMAAGIPVIAGRIPSYEEVIEHGQSGYLADTLEEYRAALRAVRDPEVRRRVAHCAYDRVKADYTIDGITNRWLELFKSLESSRNAALAHGWSDDVRGKSLWATLAVLSRLEMTLLALTREEYRAALNCFCTALPWVPVCPASLRDLAGVCLYVVRGAMRRTSERWRGLRRRWVRN